MTRIVLIFLFGIDLVLFIAIASAIDTIRFTHRLRSTGVETDAKVSLEQETFVGSRGKTQTLYVAHLEFVGWNNEISSETLIISKAKYKALSGISSAAVIFMPDLPGSAPRFTQDVRNTRRFYQRIVMLGGFLVCAVCLTIACILLWTSIPPRPCSPPEFGGCNSD